MDLPLTLVLIISCLSVVNSRPKDSAVIPKNVYKKQVLQPLPGYIPVYIQTDGADITNTRGSLVANEQPVKISNLNAKSKPKYNDGKIKSESKNFPEKKLDSEINAKKTDLFKIKESHEKSISDKSTKVM